MKEVFAKVYCTLVMLGVCTYLISSLIFGLCSIKGKVQEGLNYAFIGFTITMFVGALIYFIILLFMGYK